MKLEEIKSRLASYRPDLERYPDDEVARLTLLLALEAVEKGNFGIGCVLVGPDGSVVEQGFNEVFCRADGVPLFRSSAHGEMVVMDRFEVKHPGVTSMDGYRLYTSLESCPMCMTRLICSGVSVVLHVADDLEGGMVRNKHLLPPVWQKMMKPQVFAAARCSEELRDLSRAILMSNVAELNEKLLTR